MTKLEKLRAEYDKTGDPEVKRQIDDIVHPLVPPKVDEPVALKKAVHK